MTVLLFARARDLAGADRVEIEDAANVRELRRRLAAEHPKLALLLASSAIAVNDEYANDDMPLAPDAVIALLPPVSGG